MSRRRTLLLVIVRLTLACGVLFLFWPKQSNQPKVRIEIVRRSFEEEKEMVFFRIVGADGKWIRICQIVTVSDNSVHPSSMADIIEVVKAEEEGRVLASLLAARDKKEFGWPSPKGATVWKVRVRLTTKI